MDYKSIIAKMTVEEKASLCSGRDLWRTKPVERAGVPSIMMSDGPHGLRKEPDVKNPDGPTPSIPATCFPPAVLSACSFDRELLGELGKAIGEECIAENLKIILGPGANIKRSPLCGRNFEYFSEDPYLAGEMATAHIKGVQSTGTGTSLKHFAANNQETRRFSSDSEIDERTLNEIYLPAFKKAVQEAQPTTIMCSYNRLNGTYASENHFLLTETLRDKWGFKGLVVSDWGAVNDRVFGLKAGLDLEMPGGKDANDKKIAEAVHCGALPEEVLDLAVERLLRLIERTGGFEDRSGSAVVTDPGMKDKHNTLARRIAAESMVLLKNDGLLPLKKDAKILFAGEFAVTPRYQGAGSSQVNPVAITSALIAAAGYANVAYSKGYSTDNCEAANPVLEAEAVEAAKKADVCVLFVGLPPSFESEGYDREHMSMPAGQNSLIEAVAAVNPNVVVVMHNGAPVEMPWISKARAVLEAYLGGQAAGGAVADILFGAQNPCGKLAETLPLKLSDNPSYLYYFGERDKTEYREGIFVGYRYYDKKEMEVLFPFGHGLSYTTFDYSDLRLSLSSLGHGDKLTVTVNVANTGAVAGKEIVQLYMAPKSKDDWVIRACKELKGFAKVFLRPGETKTVSFELDETSFAYYNSELHDWYTSPGQYSILIGKSSRDIVLRADITVCTKPRIAFKPDINTPVGDILRLSGGVAIVKEMIKHLPWLSDEARKMEGPSAAEELDRAVLQMVPRQTALMGPPEFTVESVQATLDAGLGREE